MSYTIDQSLLILMALFIGSVGIFLGVLVVFMLTKSDQTAQHSQDEFERIFGFHPTTFVREDHYQSMKEKLLFLRSSSEFFELNRAIKAAVQCEQSEVITEVLAGVPNPEV